MSNEVIYSSDGCSSLIDTSLFCIVSLYITYVDDLIISGSLSIKLDSSLFLLLFIIWLLANVDGNLFNPTYVAPPRAPLPLPLYAKYPGSAGLVKSMGLVTSSFFISSLTCDRLVEFMEVD